MKTSKQTVFYASILLVSLHLVLGSCEKQLPEAGEKIPVRFLLQQAPYGDGESVTRSSASGTGEEASSVVPLGDNLYLHASLEVVPPEPTREALAFSTNAQIMIAAYEGASTTATASAVYKESSGSIVPQSSELSLEPGTYTFVAYSYNNSVPLTHNISETVSLSPATATDGNFLWGKTPAPVTISGENANTVSITIARRLSRASVRVTTPSTGGPYTISAISDITIGPGHSVDMSLKDGSFTSTESTIPQPVTGYTGLNTNTVNTDPRIVYTNGSLTTTVTIGSITVSGIDITYTNLTASFQKQLEINTSYILRVDIRKGVAWAGSNIYWVETEQTTGAGYLTFSQVGDRSKEMYQGVFFKWGSLVGVSPTQYSPGSSNVFNANDTIYVPNDNATKTNITWARTTPTLATCVTSNNWGSVPYVNVSYPSSVNMDYTDDYLTRDYDSGTGDASGGHNPAVYKGDICKYLSGQPHTPAGTWRMPTAADNRSAQNRWQNTTLPNDAYWQRIPVLDGSDWVSGSNNITNGVQCGHPDGSYNTWTHGASYCGTVVFPASGYRQVSGNLFATGSSTNYWCSTISSSNSGYALNSISSALNLNASPYRPHALPIRCVRQE